MKYKASIEFEIDTDEYGYAEHGKPFGLTEFQYAKGVAESIVNCGADLPNTVKVKVSDVEQTFKRVGNSSQFAEG